MEAHGTDDGNSERKGIVTACRLAASLEQITEVLALLEHPAAITENRVARITQICAYDQARTTGEPFGLRTNRVCLRLDPAALCGAYLIEQQAEPDGVPGLVLYAADEAPLHRCHTLLDTDRLVLSGLARIPAAPDPRWRPGFEGDGDDQLGRVDAILRAHGNGVPAVPHRHVAVGILAAVLEHACAVGLPLGIGVFSAGAFHAAQGQLHAVTASAGRTVVTTGDATVELDLAAVHDVLLVRSYSVHGATTAIELYDADRSCVGMVSQLGLVGTDVHLAWEHLAQSLPAAA